MKRYFTFATPPDPAKYRSRGAYHYMSLPGPLNDHQGGYVCVLEDENSPIPDDWVELPHLLDATPAGFNGVDTTPGAFASTPNAPPPVALAGVTHTDTMFQAAKKLAAINRHFHP